MTSHVGAFNLLRACQKSMAGIGRGVYPLMFPKWWLQSSDNLCRTVEPMVFFHAMGNGSNHPILFLFLIGRNMMMKHPILGFKLWVKMTSFFTFQPSIAMELQMLIFPFGTNCPGGFSISKHSLALLPQEVPERMPVFQSSIFNGLAGKDYIFPPPIHGNHH